MAKPVKTVIPWRPKRPAADANLRARQLIEKRTLRVVSAEPPWESPDITVTTIDPARSDGKPIHAKPMRKLGAKNGKTKRTPRPR